MSDSANPNWEPGTFFHLHEEDPVEEYQNFKLGMWIFLATEVLLFGGIFACYFLFKSRFPELWVDSSALLDKTWGGVNTVVLLASSFTMALAVDAAQRSQQKKLVFNLILTLVGACIFLAVKYFEWSHKYHIGHFLVAENDFWNMVFGAPHEGIVHQVDVYMTLYFMATGLHLLHVLVGMSFIGLLLYRAIKGRYSAENFGGVEVGGLYWHIVDIIWIFLFPLLYLV